jgi:hypothetical protein
VLRELFAALGNDPFVIAECLARPVLSERLQFAAVEWRKEPLESWSARAQDRMPNVMTAANANYTLPAISDQPSECIDDSWTATTRINAPSSRGLHTAVWTGSEMIVKEVFPRWSMPERRPCWCEHTVRADASEATRAKCMSLTTQPSSAASSSTVAANILKAPAIKTIISGGQKIFKFLRNFASRFP